MSKRVFISVPMAGRTNEQINEDIRCGKEEYLYRYPYEDVEFVDNYIDADAPSCRNPALFYLGESIKKMATCDDVVFCGNWRQARGCLVERMVYDLYIDGYFAS